MPAPGALRSLCDSGFCRVSCSQMPLAAPEPRTLSDLRRTPYIGLGFPPIVRFGIICKDHAQDVPPTCLTSLEYETMTRDVVTKDRPSCTVGARIPITSVMWLQDGLLQSCPAP